MIPKKEFYFVRHGQTAHNLLDGLHKGDHPADIALNETGREQAAAIAPVVALLPFKTICTSSMRRTIETKTIITDGQAPHHEIDDLGECTMAIWREMSSLGMYSSLPPAGQALQFMERVQRGLVQALSLPGPCLIVSHGGVHWATCCLMQIQQHAWVLENCGVVHFALDAKQNWIAKKIS